MWSIGLIIRLGALLLRLALHFTRLHQLDFTPLNHTIRHFSSSYLNFTQPHFTTVSFKLIPHKFPTAWFDLIFTNPTRRLNLNFLLFFNLICGIFQHICRMRSPLFWDITQSRLLVSLRRFGATCSSPFQGPSSLLLKMLIAKFVMILIIAQNVYFNLFVIFEK